MATLVRFPDESAEDFKRRFDVWQREVLEAIRLTPLELAQFDTIFGRAVERHARSLGIERKGDRLYFTASDHVDEVLSIPSDSGKD